MEWPIVGLENGFFQAIHQNDEAAGNSSVSDQISPQLQFAEGISPPNAFWNKPGVEMDNSQLAILSAEALLKSSIDFTSIEPSTNQDISTANLPAKKRPCDGCRKRKAKCLMLPNYPSCLDCEIRKRPCTFLEGPKRRKHNSQHSKSSAQTSTPSNQPTQPNESTQSSYENGQTHISPKSANGSGFTNNVNTVSIPNKRLASAIRDISPIQDYSTVRGHTLLKKTLSLQYPKSSFYVGCTSVLDLNLLDVGGFDKTDQAKLTGDIFIRKVASNVVFTLKNDYSDDLYEQTIQDVDTVEKIVSPYGRILIDVYFRIVHASFPILHKKVFLEKYSRTHREFLSPLLAAVYLLAMNWWNYDVRLSSHPKPDTEALYQHAIRTFADVLQRPKLSAVQAGLLLLQCRPENARNWALCSQVIALAEELGLGMDCRQWRLPKWERNLRRKLAWGVFVQDKWLALTEARPSHIDKSRFWQVTPLSLQEDFPDKANSISNGGGTGTSGFTSGKTSASPASVTSASEEVSEEALELRAGKLVFIEMTKLTEILSDILDTLYTYKAQQTLVDTETILQQAKPLQLRLWQWRNNLPPTLFMDSNVPRRKLSSNGYLHLAYYSAEITLYRRIIGSINPSTPQELVNLCRNAAQVRLITAIDFVRDLRPEHVQSFWHSSAPSNFALIGSFAALLHITAVDEKEADLYKQKLMDYRWILKVSSKGFEHMSVALQLLETAVCRVSNLIGDENKFDDSSEEEEEEDYEEDEAEDDEVMVIKKEA